MELAECGAFRDDIIVPRVRYATSIFDYQFEDLEIIDYKPHSAIAAEISVGYL